MNTCAAGLPHASVGQWFTSEKQMLATMCKCHPADMGSFRGYNRLNLVLAYHCSGARAPTTARCCTGACRTVLAQCRSNVCTCGSKPSTSPIQQRAAAVVLLHTVWRLIPESRRNRQPPASDAPDSNTIPIASHWPHMRIRTYVCISV
jgi:hypothetical protein